MESDDDNVGVNLWNYLTDHQLYGRSISRNQAFRMIKKKLGNLGIMANAFFT